MRKWMSTRGNVLRTRRRELNVPVQDLLIDLLRTTRISVIFFFFYGRWIRVYGRCVILPRRQRGVTRELTEFFFLHVKLGKTRLSKLSRFNHLEGRVKIKVHSDDDEESAESCDNFEKNFFGRWIRVHGLCILLPRLRPDVPCERTGGFFYT